MAALSVALADADALPDLLKGDGLAERGVALGTRNPSSSAAIEEDRRHAGRVQSEGDAVPERDVSRREDRPPERDPRAAVLVNPEPLELGHLQMGLLVRPLLPEPPLVTHKVEGQLPLHGNVPGEHLVRRLGGAGSALAACRARRGLCGGRALVPRDQGRGLLHACEARNLRHVRPERRRGDPQGRAEVEHHAAGNGAQVVALDNGHKGAGAVGDVPKAEVLELAVRLAAGGRARPHAHALARRRFYQELGADAEHSPDRGLLENRRGDAAERGKALRRDGQPDKEAGLLENELVVLGRRGEAAVPGEADRVVARQLRPPSHDVPERPIPAWDLWPPDSHAPLRGEEVDSPRAAEGGHGGVPGAVRGPYLGVADGGAERAIGGRL
mmetsp:Transcript_28505/g.67928  ORF Transcript_28505/g.67928 Transcript_28505/m.67928 type:complete len:385 (+) Transcript_28505:2236-3390(+)